MEKEPQLDVLRARDDEKKRVRERGCGTETIGGGMVAGYAMRCVRMCEFCTWAALGRPRWTLRGEALS